MNPPPSVLPRFIILFLGLFNSFFHTSLSIWSLTYFFLVFYILLVFLAILYLVSNIKEFTAFTAFKGSHVFQYVSGLDLLLLFFVPGLLIYVLNFSWVGPSLTAWFGHLVFNQTQLRLMYLLLGLFVLLWAGYLTTLYYTSQEVYDFTMVLYSFFVWMALLFYSNNLFTVIFFIEVLSTAISLTIITSVFSSAYFYNNLDFSNHSYFQHSTPFSFLQTLIFFFWISLIGSLGLFIFLSLLYLHLLTFDWYTLEYSFYYYTLLGTSSTLVTLSLVWLSFLFCLFLKCGLVPFFFWNPIFFNGIPIHSLFFYITFFYFFLFLYFSLFLLVYLNELFYFNLYLNLTLVVIGFIFLIFLICESFYINAFLAMSSILNTLLVFLVFNANTFSDLVLTF